MTLLFLDTETYSECDLKVHGTPVYAADPSTEIMIAQWKRQNGNIDEYASHKMVAVDILRKEATAHNGKARTPAITFSRGWGLGSDFNPVR